MGYKDVSSKYIAEDETLGKNLDKNIQRLKEIFGESSDIAVRKFNLGKTGLFGAIFFVDGLAGTDMVAKHVLNPLMYLDFEREEQVPKSIKELEEKFVISGEVKTEKNIDKCIFEILSGNTLFMADTIEGAVIINTKGFERRSVTDPETDSVIRGPREGFIENLRTNTALLRRKIKTPSFTIESMTVGRKTKTYVALAYLADVAQKELVDEVKRRIEKIDTDAILDSGYIEQFIQDKGSPVFSLIANTEKPDVAAAKILEGRVCIIVDGSPSVLTAPAIFAESFQTSEDYYISPLFSSLLRMVRILAFFISILVLPIYVAFTSFHQELIPTALLFTIAKAAAGTPFPVVIEAIIMVITFEILKEAGVRLPKPVGQAISMVGALVIGETAVSAGLISAPMSIAVAITAVSTYANPSQSNVAFVLRFLLLILAGTLGGFGILMGMMFIAVHLASLKSFGTPYLAPFAPVRPYDLKDSVIRAPMKFLLTRPEGIAKSNPRRQTYKD